VSRATIFEEVSAERDRQDDRWGEQNHPMVGQAARRGFVVPQVEASRLLLPSAGSAREFCDHEHRIGCGTYTSIAVEEIAEFVEACVLHGETSDEARKELVQATAVLVAMLETIDRRRSAR
jgi:hypothetical protein